MKLSITFDGFQQEDFEAYQPAKWSSNMYTLARRRVKDKLDFVGDRLASLLADQGFNQVKHLSDDHPSLWNKKKVSVQWLFFSRDLSAQKELQELIDTKKTLAATLEDPTPFYRHIFFGVAVDEQGIEVGIRVHHDAWVDRDNLLAAWANPVEAVRFTELANGLGADAQLCIDADDTPIAASTVTADQLPGLAERYQAGGGFAFVGVRLDRGPASDAGVGIISQIETIATQLLPLYRYLTWRPDNDRVSLDQFVEERQKERQAAHNTLEAQKADWAAKHDQVVAERQRVIEQKKQDLLEEQAWRERERAKRRAAAVAKRAQAEAAFASFSKPAQSKSAAAPVSAPTDEPVKPTTDQLTTDQDPNGNMAPSTPAENDRRPVRGRSGAGSDRPRPSAIGAGKAGGRRDAGGRGPRTDSAGSGKGRSGERRGQRNGAAGRPRQDHFAKPPKTTGRKSAVNVSDERKAQIQVGDLVRVNNGFLSGKEGVVQSIDEKGDLKVSFGLLSSRVSKQEVTGMGPAN